MFCIVVNVKKKKKKMVLLTLIIGDFILLMFRNYRCVNLGGSCANILIRFVSIKC